MYGPDIFITGRAPRTRDLGKAGRFYTYSVGHGLRSYTMIV